MKLINISVGVQSQNKIVLFILTIVCIGLFSCQSEPQAKAIPKHTFNDDGSINVYIEIPAGESIKYEYDAKDRSLKPDQVDNEDRIIDFLPYVGNYGFIAGTKMDKKDGGDGDALDVLVLSAAVPKGDIMRVLPIAVILLEDNGEKDHKIIAVPFAESERSINVEKFSTFITKYNAAQFIVQEWFMNYKGLGQMKLLGWKDEEFARKEVKKWSLDE